MDVLIGSTATKIRFPDYYKEPNDIDLIGYSKGHDCHPPESNPGLQWIYDREWMHYLVGNTVYKLPTSDILYTLKVSHSFWDIHWHKTMTDIRFLQSKDCRLNEELFSLLYSGWKKIHGAKKAKLKVKNEEFFTNNVNRKFPHDDLHKAVAYYDEPMYNRIKRDKSLAQVEYDMFLDLTYEDKLKLCREEMYVVALERFIIPEVITNSFRAYQAAGKLLITSMTKGWFPKFIVENWNVLYKPDKHNFLERFENEFKVK